MTQNHGELRKTTACLKEIQSTKQHNTSIHKQPIIHKQVKDKQKKHKGQETNTS